MTVSSQTNKIIYIGNGVAKEFAIPFSFWEKEHIKVRQKKNDIQTERTDWTVKNGNLVFAIAPENGAEIAIVREVPLTQETDYRDNEILHAETLERNFDKLTMQVQQLAEKQDRAVTVDIFDDIDAASLIPSIRQAVSDCAAYAATAAGKVDDSSDFALSAMEQAVIAAEQACIAAQKAIEAQNTLSNKAEIDLNNLNSTGKEKILFLVAPDYDTAVSFSLNENEEWEASCFCILTVCFSYSNGNISGFVDGVPLWTIGSTATTAENRQWCLVPRGSRFKSNASVSCVYYKLKGV